MNMDIQQRPGYNISYKPNNIDIINLLYEQADELKNVPAKPVQLLALVEKFPPESYLTGASYPINQAEREALASIIFKTLAMIIALHDLYPSQYIEANEIVGKIIQLWREEQPLDHQLLSRLRTSLSTEITGMLPPDA